MARGLAYELRFDSEKYNHSHLIEIWEEDYTGSKTLLSMGESGLISKREREGGIYGTSMTLRLESTLDSQLVKLYTSDAKKFLVRHYRNNVLVQSGFIVPEQYSEEYIAAPYDVVVTVVDGLGVLKDTQFAYFGRHSILEVLKYCLDSTGLILDFDIVCALTEIGTDPTRSVFAQVQIDTEKWRDRSIYDALGELTATFRAFITQYNGRWRFARYADLQEYSLIYTNSLTYLVALPNPVTILGNTSDALFPIGSLSLTIDPAFKKANFTRTYDKRQSFLQNPNFKLLDDWVAEGDIRTTYEGDVHYVVLEATAESQQLSQTIIVEKSERQFLFEISFYRIGDLPTYFRVYFELQGLNNTYWLGPSGWQSAQAEFKMETASDDHEGFLDSIFSTSKDLKKGRSQQETGSIRFKTFPESGLLTIHLVARGPTTVPVTSERSLFYITAANLTTETERGLSVNTLLTSGNVDAPATEIFFSDPDVGDNADRILHNYMTRVSDGVTTSNWKVGAAGTVDTFFNTLVRDYVAFYGLTKRILGGIIMGNGLQSAFCILDKFADTYAYIDTITLDVYADQAEVTIQEIIPHLELIGITDEESIETMPRVVAYWDTLPDGTRVKRYSILAEGNTYRRLSSRTTDEMTYEELLRTRALANFTKALAALSQKKADAANIAALAASETADDAILRLNNIVNNSIVSVEEKAGLIELMERLADEMDLYASDSNNKGADLTALQTSYNALVTFLNDDVDVDSGIAKELTPEQVVQYNTLFANFYAKRSVFSTDISAIRAELLSYQTRISEIDKDKARVTAEYNALNSAEGLTTTQKATLTTAKTQYESEHSTYKAALSQIIADDKVTAEERTAAGTAFTAYSTKLNSFNVAAENAKRIITDTIGTTLSAWTADGVISPLEKLAVKQTRAQITSEKEALLADADIYGIDDADYATAWAAYDAVLVKYSADAPENIPVEDDFLTSETNYKTEKVALRTAITTAQKTDTGEKHPKEGSPDLDMTVKNLVAVGWVGFYGGVGSGSTPAQSLLDLSDIDSTLSTAAVGSPLVKLANGKWGPGSVSIDLSNYFSKEESDARFAFKSHSHDYVAPTAFNSHTADMVKHITAAERAAWNAKESALNNPDADGKILASTASGVRSWVSRYILPVAAAAMLGGVMIGNNVNVDAQGRISVAAPYSHPASHPASMITEDSTRRFLTDTERLNWNDAYDKRHTHGNKSNLDSINQNLSQTSNVKFNDVVADGSIAFYGGVGSGSTPVASLLDLSDIDASISAAATGTPLVKLANGKWGAGSVSIDLSNYYNKSDSDARYAFKSHSHDYVTTSVFNGHTHSFTSLTSRPTTLSGYGITNALPRLEIGDGNANTFFGADSFVRTTGPTSNFPITTNNGGVLLTLRGFDVNASIQLFSQASAANLYIRTITYGTEAGWYKIYSTGNLLNIGTTASSARIALGLGTMATENASSYLPLSGGIMTLDSVIRKKAFVGSSWERVLMRFENSNASIQANIGAFGGTDSISFMYLGFNTYNADNLRVYPDKIQFGNSVVYHSGNTATIKSDLSLGSNAYTSTAYLPVLSTAADSSRLGGVLADYFVQGSSNRATSTANGDVNTFWKAGFYTAYNTTNFINNADGGFILIPTWPGASSTARYMIQLGGTIGSSLRYRSTDINGAGSWRTIYDSSNSNLTTVSWSVGNLIMSGSITGATTITASGIANVGGFRVTGNIITGNGVGLEIFYNNTNQAIYFQNYHRGIDNAYHKIYFGASEYSFDTGLVKITNTNQSTAYTNGALVLAGGLGISKDLFSNGKAYFGSYVESASYIQAAYYKLGNWEIKQNASGELEFILSGALKFKITSTGIVSSGEVDFYS